MNNPKVMRHELATFKERFASAAHGFAILVGDQSLTTNQLVDAAVQASAAVGFEWGSELHELTELSEFFVRYKDVEQRQRVLTEVLAVYQFIHFKQ